MKKALPVFSERLKGVVTKNFPAPPEPLTFPQLPHQIFSSPAATGHSESQGVAIFMTLKSEMLTMEVRLIPKIIQPLSQGVAKIVNSGFH